MRQLFLIIALTACTTLFAQQQQFDIVSYTAPKAWKKDVKKDLVQFTKEDKTKNTYCLITLYKAIDAGDNTKQNFDLSWEALVKETLGSTDAPTMQDPASEDGWSIETGYATFENDGNKGIAMLVTATGSAKAVNVLVLTNTDAYEADVTKFLESLDIKKPATKPANNTVKNNPPPVPVSNSKFKFTTTNFDDGWTAVEKEDWVEVTKGKVKVLLHYPKEGTVFPADPAPMTNAAWDILVAPRYSNLRNYKTSYISNYIRGYLGMGYMKENATNADVFVFFFRMNNGWIECVTPDKKTFMDQFKFDPEAMRWDSEVEAVKTVDIMATYNKFAVAASDLNGTGEWSSNFSSNTYYANIYTGMSAGMSTYTSGQDFTFLPGQKFKWNLVAANSYGGSTSFAQAKGEGNWKMNNDWEIWFSNIEKKPKRYSAYFSCIKGARFLHLLDADYPGSGIYTQFGRVVKEKK